MRTTNIVYVTLDHIYTTKIAIRKVPKTERVSELSAAAARHCAYELRPHGCQTDKQAPQKCREGPCTTFQSMARLYVDAVIMAKPRRRDVMGEENNSTNYEPSEM